MWRRFRRRTFAPTRPVLLRDQIPLAAATVVLLVVGILVVVLFLR